MMLERPSIRFNAAGNHTSIVQNVSPRVAKLQVNWPATQRKANAPIRMGKGRLPPLKISDAPLLSSGVGYKEFARKDDRPSKHNKIKPSSSSPNRGASIQKRTKNSKKRNRAATVIQSMMRGWWQRLQFRIMFLRYQLSRHEESTEASVHRIQQDLQEKKTAFREKTELEIDESQALDQTSKERQAVIQKRRKENRRLRDRNARLFNLIESLKTNNKQLEDAVYHADSCLRTLRAHVDQLHVTHDTLIRILPKGKSNVEIMDEKVKLYEQYCTTERKIKVKCLKTIGEIVEEMESKSVQDDLVNEVVEECLLLEITNT